jgi:BlaI family transcriptional regulator, penicillinase repressor
MDRASPARRLIALALIFLEFGIRHLEFERGAAMARPARPQPTEGELEILKVLWDQGPSELKQVCAALRQGRPVATTTVATMLKLMQEKGLVVRGEAGRRSVYSAQVSREAASTSLVRRLMDLVFDGSARRLVAHMLETETLTDCDRAEIRRLLDEDERRTVTAPRSRKKKGGRP